MSCLCELYCINSVYSKNYCTNSIKMTVVMWTSAAILYGKNIVKTSRQILNFTFLTVESALCWRHMSAGHLQASKKKRVFSFFGPEMYEEHQLQEKLWQILVDHGVCVNECDVRLCQIRGIVWRPASLSTLLIMWLSMWKPYGRFLNLEVCG